MCSVRAGRWPAAVGCRRPEGNQGPCARFPLLTTAGSPVATAACGAVLKRSRTGQTCGPRRRSALRRLRELAGQHEIVDDVRGRVLALGIDPVADCASREPLSATTTAKVVYRSYELDAALTYVELKANVLEFMPALTLTEDEVGQALGIVDQVIADRWSPNATVSRIVLRAMEKAPRPAS